MEKIGFIGLGIMGRPMAKNLLKAGYQITAYDIDADAVGNLAGAGAIPAASIADSVKGADVVVTMLPNSPHVKEVILGSGGVLENAGKGVIIIDTSSIAPIASKEIARECLKKDIIYLDCPVSGGEPKAIDGTLAIMCGGPDGAFDRVKPILLKMAASAVLVGGVGSGNIAKLANQIIVAVNIAGMSEALALAAKSGADPQRVYQAIRGGLAGSAVLDAKAPMVFARSFKPGFRVNLHIKDLNNVMDTAHAIDSPVPLSAQVLEMMHAVRVEGHDASDHSALAAYYEKLMGMEIVARTTAD
jgi:2-hydroxy-3-oxopropionate reductase